MWRLISVATLASLRVRKWSRPIQSLIVPKTCSTMLRWTRMALGISFKLAEGVGLPAVGRMAGDRRSPALTPAGDERGKLPLTRPSRSTPELDQLGGFATFALSGNQTPDPLVTTVKLGRAAAGLVLCMTLNAATGRRRSLSSRFPRSSNLATASTASAMWLLTRIWPSLASAQSRAARLHTVPIAV